jgi:hypothetical protein
MLDLPLSPRVSQHPHEAKRYVAAWLAGWLSSRVSIEHAGTQQHTAACPIMGHASSPGVASERTRDACMQSNVANETLLRS